MAQERSFSGEFDGEFSLSPEGLSAIVGRGVLRGLIRGIDEALRRPDGHAFSAPV